MYQEVGLWNFERVETRLQSFAVAGAVQRREDGVVDGAAEAVDQLHALARVRIFGDDVGGENVRNQVEPLQRFQFKGERVADGDRRRRPALVHDEQANARVQYVLCW